MILLACVMCLPYEAERIPYVQPLLNRTIEKHCFANELAARGVSDYWINQIQGANTNLKLYYYRENNGTVGYTYLYDSTIYLNRKFHDGYNLCQTGSNVAHELTHALGYAHPSNGKNDVSYKVNAAFEACCTLQPPILD